MVHLSYSRLSFRLFCKRQKYLAPMKSPIFCQHRSEITVLKGHFSKRVNKYVPVVTSFRERCSLVETKKRLNQNDIISDEIKNCSKLDSGNLVKIKERVLSINGDIDEHNFNAVFIGHCINEKAFHIGKLFFHLLHDQGKCNLASIMKFFRLCYECSSKCSDSDKEFLIGLCNNLLEKYKILDFRTCENVALGLSITSQWKMGLKLLEMCKISSLPSTKMYSVLASTAFLNNDFDVGWKLMHEMSLNNRRIEAEVFNAWMEASGFSFNNYQKVLNFLEKYDIHPTDDLAVYLLKTFKKVKEPIQHCTITKIHASGSCQKCHNKLKPVSLSEKEFVKLRSAFLDPVLIGKDIFLRTKPQEFQSFQSFLKQSRKIDVVLDGLNIAYAKDHRKFNRLTAAQMLCDVVKHFIKLSKNVAVIGRKHMESWPLDKMNYVKRNANLFLAENVSADDPYLLYAAMNSGLGTCFVSRDQMRGHKFLLKDPELMKLFSRWQQKHQLYFQYVTPNGSVQLTEPPPYLLSVQSLPGDVWHLPIYSTMEGVPGHLVARNTKWLCMS